MIRLLSSSEIFLVLAVNWLLNPEIGEEPKEAMGSSKDVTLRCGVYVQRQNLVSIGQAMCGVCLNGEIVVSVSVCGRMRFYWIIFCYSSCIMLHYYSIIFGCFYFCV